VNSLRNMQKNTASIPIKINNIRRTNFFFTMNCPKARILMSAAVDGELSRKEEEGFLLHLTKCLECKGEFEEAKKTKMIIKERIIQFKAPQTLVHSIMQLTSVSAIEHEDTLFFE